MNRTESLTPLPSKVPAREKNRRYRGGCKNCKEKKKGCTRETPTCQRCKERGLECTYPPLQPRRSHGARRQASTTPGGSSADSGGPTMRNSDEVSSDFEQLSLPENFSRESSIASMADSVAVPYFCNTLAPLLVVPNPNSNPLIDHVLPLADESEEVLDAILLLSKAHQAHRSPNMSQSSYLDLYLVVLRSHMNTVNQAHNSNPNLHLTVNVLLSYFEMIRSQSSNDLKICLGGGFLLLRMENLIRNPTTVFLEKVLFFFDVLRSLSSAQPPLNPNPHSINEPQRPSLRHLSGDVDPVFGVSGPLWPALHRLATAVHRKHQRVQRQDTAGYSQAHAAPSPTAEELETERRELTNLLKAWQSPLPGQGESPEQLKRFQGLIEHAKAYRSAGMIVLYRELFEQIPASPDVQKPARSILEACQRILTEGGPTMGLLWPLFIASINLLDAPDISTAKELFSHLLAQRGTANIPVAREICEQLWTRRSKGMWEVPWREISPDLQDAIVFG